MTGTIDQIGTDINQIKAMGVEHIIFGHAFSPLGKEMKKAVEITKQLDFLNNEGFLQEEEGILFLPID